jgi:hypothetical protein
MFRRSAGVRCTDTSTYKKRAFPFSCDDRSRRFEGGGDEDTNAKHSGNSSCDRRLNSALHAQNTQHCHEVARASSLHFKRSGQRSGKQLRTLRDLRLKAGA